MQAANSSIKCERSYFPFKFTQVEVNHFLYIYTFFSSSLHLFSTTGLSFEAVLKFDLQVFIKQLFTADNVRAHSGAVVCLPAYCFSYTVYVLYSLD